MAIPDIYDELFKYAKKHIQEKSIYSPSIKKATPSKMNTFPLVIMKKPRIRLKSETLKYGEKKFNIDFEIEIYTMDKSNVAKQVITEELRKLLLEVFFEHYIFDIDEDDNIPNIDLNVDRHLLRFKGVIDENKKIYRR